MKALMQAVDEWEAVKVEVAQQTPLAQSTKMNWRCCLRFRRKHLSILPDGSCGPSRQRVLMTGVTMLV